MPIRESSRQLLETARFRNRSKGILDNPRDFVVIGKSPQFSLGEDQFAVVLNLKDTARRPYQLRIYAQFLVQLFRQTGSPWLIVSFSAVRNLADAHRLLGPPWLCISVTSVPIISIGSAGFKTCGAHSHDEEHHIEKRDRYSFGKLVLSQVKSNHQGTRTPRATKGCFEGPQALGMVSGSDPAVDSLLGHCSAGTL